MKSIWFLVMVCCGVVVGKAQSLNPSAVPKVVQEKIQAAYPGMKVLKWEREAADYEAELMVNGVETSVVVDARGRIKETESAMRPEDLPKAVLQSIANKGLSKQVDEAAKIVDASGKVTYEAEIGGKDYLFDEAGRLAGGGKGSGGDGSGKEDSKAGKSGSRGSEADGSGDKGSADGSDAGKSGKKGSGGGR